MRSILSAFSTIAVLLNPVAVLAGNQFVTSESVRLDESGQIVTSLSAGNELQINADGILVFEGQALASNGMIIPIAVQVQTAGRNEAPSIAEFAELTGRVSLTGQSVFSPEIDGVEIEKSIYTLVSRLDGAAGSITLTDEPLPVVVGWLAFAALASFTGLSATIIVICNESGGKIVASVSADLDERKGEVSVVCEPQ